jgi:uncharacterized Zn finger protein (UPF0148 family)
MTCPKCGAQLLEGSTFCGACGNVDAAQLSHARGIQIDEDSRGRGEVTTMKYYINHRSHSLCFAASRTVDPG